MITSEYQEYCEFMDRYRGVVFGYVTTDLMKYTRLPPPGWIRDLRIRDDSLRDMVDGKMIVPEGPYVTEYHYNTNHEGYGLVKEATVTGPSQYDNFLKVVTKVTDSVFPRTIEKYAVHDRDYTHCRDCADELARKLTGYWGMHE